MIEPEHLRKHIIVWPQPLCSSCELQFCCYNRHSLQQPPQTTSATATATAAAATATATAAAAAAAAAVLPSLSTPVGAARRQTMR